jgi:hypothetical protein
MKWHIIYKELSKLLYKFYEQHKAQSGEKLYSILHNDKEFIFFNEWILKFNPSYGVESVDPMHIFSSLNGNKLTNEKRISRINVLFRLLSKETKPFEKIDFNGCPAPTTINLLSARIIENQQDIWYSFYRIEANPNNFNESTFEKTLTWFGIDVTSFTIFLFWINSDYFLPLDKHTIGFLMANKKIKEKPDSFRVYKKLLLGINTGIYREIALVSYQNRSFDEVINYSVELKDYLGIKKFEKLKKYDFKIVALKPISGSSIKSLNKNSLYVLYKNYDFENDKKIKYSSKNLVSIYDVADLNINISAIVGKNGSGKSTIVELIILAINNLAYHYFKDKPYNNVLLQEETQLELYVQTDTLYRIVIDKKEVYVYQYILQKDCYILDPKPINKIKFIKNNFFYTIAINYSHYALNTKNIGPWLHPLFHKNDGYQTPVVINPKRTKGNIDITNEDHLVTTRLLYMFLIPLNDSEKREESLRSIAKEKDTFKVAHKISLKLNQEKYNPFEKKTKYQKNDKERVLKAVYREFEISSTLMHSTNKLIAHANEYIYKKLIKIPELYQAYEKYINPNTERLKYLKKYVSDLNIDPSHIAFKIKQTINFLKYDLLSKEKEDFDLNIEDFSAAIQNHRKNDSETKIIHFAPPPIFNMEFILIDEKNIESEFTDLSSGEKQNIYSTSTLLYHILNIDSVNKSETMISYRSINVIFDEIELYYHPELQRKFIAHLMQTIDKVSAYLESIKEINFSFITHSPFILSDIPKNNILFLGNMQEEAGQTFASNIHDLLANSFFLNEGFMGEFAKRKIQDLIRYLKFSPDKEISESNPKHDEEWNQDSAEKLIQIIGEPLIKQSLQSLYDKKFIMHDKKIILQKINQLKQELKKL